MLTSLTLFTIFKKFELTCNLLTIVYTVQYVQYMLSICSAVAENNLTFITTVKPVKLYTIINCTPAYILNIIAAPSKKFQ